MKQKILLIAILLLSISISFSQSESFEKYITDTDGKLYYSDTEKEISEIIDKNKLNKNLIRNLSIIWNNEDYDISDNKNADSWDPRIDVGADGTLYVVYNDNHAGTGLQKIMFRKKEPSGDWTEPIYIDKGGDIGARNNHFPAVAVSPNGDIHSIYCVWAYENTRNFIGYSFYDASEDEWSDGVEISEAGGSVYHFDAHHDIYSTDNNLPVVIWGFDNRENEDYEEIYMKYFDGTSWSSDIIVSTASDNLSASYPYMISIGNNEAMIIFEEENGNPNEHEIRYRIYDETTHTLTAIQTIPQTMYNSGESFTVKYDIAKKDNENAIIAIWQNPNSSPYKDTIKCINYDIATEVFVMSDHKFINETSGSFPKHLSVDCDSEGNCAIIYTDTYPKTCNFIEFDSVSGFSEIQVFNSEDLIDSPECKFDSDGNLHVVWPDLRFDIPGGYVEREVFYEMGTNIENTYTVTFIVTEADGITPVEDAEVTFYSNTQNTSPAGEIAFSYILPGTYSWTVSKTAYETETGEAIVTDQNIFINVSLNEILTYTVTFNVDDGTDPIDGAEIVIDGETLITAGGGIATIDLANGDYPYTVDYGTCDQYTGTVTVYSSTVTVDVSMTCPPPTYTVTFTVDDGTAVIIGALVDIEAGTYTATTDASGEAIFNLEEGSIDYIVTAGGFDDFTDTYTVTTDAGQTVAVHMTETISVKNLTAAGISVYPNPSNGIFNIYVKNNYNLEVLDITGKIINTQALTGSSIIEINNAGVYFLRFSNNKTTVVQRVIVE